MQAGAFARAGEMAVAAGAHERGGALFGEAIALYESSGDTHAAARAASWLGFSELLGGRIENAIERMERAYATVEGDEPDAEVGLLLARLGQAHYFAGDREHAAEWVELALDIGEALQLTDVLIRGWTTKSGIIAPSRPEEARSLLQVALDTALLHNDLALANTCFGNLSDLSLQRDRYADSLALLEESLAQARRIGHRRSEWFALSEMTYALTMLGRWQEALDRFAEMPEEELGRTTNLSSVLCGPLEIHVQRGRLSEARQLLARWEELTRSADLYERMAFDQATAAVRLGEGNAADALVAAESVLEGREAAGIAQQDVKLACLRALEAALELEDRNKAEEVLALIEPLPVGLRPPLLTATAHRFRARLAGDDPAADGHFTSAAAQLRSLELLFHLAVVLLEHGEWLMWRGRPDDAAPLLAEARELFERLEAAPGLARVDALLPAGREPEPVPAG